MLAVDLSPPYRVVPPRGRGDVCLSPAKHTTTRLSAASRSHLVFSLACVSRRPPVTPHFSLRRNDLRYLSAIEHFFGAIYSLYLVKLWPLVSPVAYPSLHDTLLHE